MKSCFYSNISAHFSRYYSSYMGSCKCFWSDSMEIRCNGKVWWITKNIPIIYHVSFNEVELKLFLMYNEELLKFFDRFENCWNAFNALKYILQEIYLRALDSWNVRARFLGCQTGVKISKMLRLRPSLYVAILRLAYTATESWSSVIV